MMTFNNIHFEDNKDSNGTHLYLEMTGKVLYLGITRSDNPILMWKTSVNTE